MSVVDKEGLRIHFLTKYREEGFEATKDSLKTFLKDSGKAAKKAKDSLEAITQFRGELAEIAIEVVLQEFMSRNKRSFYVKNLCVEKKVKGGWSDYNELDVTLFTENKVVMFESKAYAGVKTLIGDCTITRPNKESMDVAKQSVSHLTVIKDWIDIYRIKNTEQKGYKIVFFDFSLDATKDERSTDAIERIPHLTLDTTLDYLQGLMQSETEKIWKIDKVLEVCEKLDKVSEANMQRHLSQLEKNKSKMQEVQRA